MGWMEGDDWPPLRATAEMRRRRESAIRIHLNDRLYNFIVSFYELSMKFLCEPVPTHMRWQR